MTLGRRRFLWDVAAKKIWPTVHLATAIAPKRAAAFRDTQGDLQNVYTKPRKGHCVEVCVAQDTNRD
jgi:hypothetical protein